MNDVGASFKQETLNKTHNNQNLNPNVVTVVHNIVERPLDTPILGSDMIDGQRAKIYGVAAPGQVPKTRLVSVILIDSTFNWT
jgi:hypothetical protein